MAGPVPTTSEWTLDLDEVINAASERLPGPRRAIEIQTCRRAVQFCFSRFATIGLNLWTVEMLVSLQLEVNVASYTLPADTLDVLEMIYRDVSLSAPTEVAITRGSRDGYTLQPNKADTGPPSMAYLHRGRDNPTLYVWPAPDRAYELRYNRVRMFRDTGNMLAGVDVPDRWLGVVVAGVAHYLGMTQDGITEEQLARLKNTFEDELMTISPEDRDRSVFKTEIDLATYYRV
jgi:hypothetical protein